VGRLSKTLELLVFVLLGLAPVFAGVGGWHLSSPWVHLGLVCAGLAVVVFLSYWVVHPLLVQAEERVILPTRERRVRNRRRRALLEDDVSGFVLVRATSKGPGMSDTDVTGLMLPKVDGGRLIVNVDKRALGDDPRARTLEVEWRQCGGQYRKTFAEGEQVELPEH
jgi:hypothetical protein